MTISSNFPDTNGVPKIEARAYLDWPAVFAGIGLASAISVVLLAFGSALGLSFGDVTSKSAAIGTSIAVAIWFSWVEVSSFMAGAYLTGRLRRPAAATSTHEAEVRDGSHGLVVWAGCVLLGSALAISGAASTIKSAGNVVKTAVETTATAAAGAAPSAMQYYSDTLLRPAPGAAPVAQGDRMALGSEVSAILARSALAAPTDDDKTYLAQAVARQTGVSEADATARVNKAYADIETAKANAAEVAETARQVSVIAAFLLAATLLVSAAAAYWAAHVGGKHRDEGAIYDGFFQLMNPRR
ncbi:hypothetical protein [Aestuariivirga litoralis]|uniref:hypothetical protein n=1 Tax=Aestuariivirga litoralis TaxID=2650924 RepID=UPI0018C6DF6A|nr:hypothetical protein [Aestuariivirga litoralis]MBG1233722.1 hypothetical protein [Aestuariivirga litoralis]